jgi:molybdopterin converting factor small subunit
MRIEVGFWGVTRRLAGTDVLALELPEGATVAVAVERLATHGELSEALDRCAFAIGSTLVARSHVLDDGDQLAVLPPVSGG